MSGQGFQIPTPDSSTGKAHVAEMHGGVPTGLGQLLWHMFSDTANRFPDREAIVALQEKPDGSTKNVSEFALRWSYKELISKVDDVSHRLGHLGCGGVGNNLVVVTRNIAEWGLFFWVAAKLGMAFVPLDPFAADDLPILLTTAAPQVIVVEDDEMAQKVDNWAGQSKLAQLAKITICDDIRSGWFSIAQIQAETHKLCQMKCQWDSLRASGTSSTALIIFTSGTTGVPKACVHTHENIMSQTNDYDPHPDPEFVDRWLIHTPVHHIFAINNALRAWRVGSVAVFPSPTFSVKTSLRALIQEQCTIMSATPTLVKAMLAESDYPGPDQLNLRIVSLASTMISPEDIALCKESLGCREAIQAYGMSEAGPLVSWCRGDPLLNNGFHQGVGKVLAGASIRICQPGTRDVLYIGDVGELHVSGTSVISGYLANADSSSFYEEDGRRWLVTGDQAKIDSDGIVYILGRYKDLIIRGGENIDPAVIERAISALSNIEVQVVGQPDSIAGEVPVAIVKRPITVSNSAIFEKARALGPKYTLGAIYGLSQLGYSEMPMTSLKKPRRQLLKVALEKVVKTREERRLSQEQAQGISAEQSILTQKLASIWEELCGVRPTAKQSVHSFADSILLLQYCDRVFRSVQIPLYLQDLMDNKDIQSHAALLLRRRSGSNSSSESTSATSGGVVVAQRRQLSINIDYPKEVHSIAASVLPSGATPESVIPLRANQYRMVEGQRPQSYHIRLAYHIRNLPGAKITEALKSLVSRTPLLRSVLLKSTTTGTWQHALCSENLVEDLLHESQAATEGQVKVSATQEPTSTLCLPYVFRADSIKCLDTSNHFLILSFNHAAVDAMSLWAILRNLDDLLHDSAAKLPEPVPYSLWADLWQQNRSNSLARSAVAQLSGRLRGVSRFPEALWPPQRAPGWMIADDSNSAHFSARNAAREAVWEGTWASVAGDFRIPRRGRIVRLPQLAALQAERGIAADVVARCAVILFNVRQTGSPYAVFHSWEAARSWPFVPGWMQSHLPPAMGVDGPTTQWRLNMYGTVEGETVLEFLKRIQTEEVTLEEYNHAPWDDVKAALSEEAAVAEDASFRQGFVWDVTLGMSAQSRRFSNYKILEPQGRHDWPDCGLFWNAFMLDKENMYFLASWDTAQMNATEIDYYCDRMAESIRALASSSNWDVPLKDVLPVLPRTTSVVQEPAGL